VFEEHPMGTVDPARAGTPQSTFAESEGQYRSLMRRYQAGDGQAFEALYARLAPDLEAYLETLLPGCTADRTLVDEVFITIHRARRSYDPRQSFEPWVAAIARHVAQGRRPPGHRRTSWRLGWES
jgi:DNA-directed RNA polymerase specialized sigma24 family protein